MSNSTEKWWLGVEIAPVQKFIEAARSVRDLQVGSSLLSLLATHAIKSGIQAGGAPLFPDLSSTEGGLEGVPNRFTLLFENEAAAKQGAIACRNAVGEFWQSLADQVHVKLVSKLGAGWDAHWDDQVRNYWVVQTAIAGPDALASPEAEALLTEKESTPFQTYWRLLGLTLALQKQVRSVPSGGGIGRDKCTLFGDMEQMGPGGKLSDQAAFWKKAAIHGKLKLRDRDRLCAIGLIKRLAADVSDEPRLKRLAGAVKDTSEIALDCWRESCKVVEAVEPLLRDWDDCNRTWAEVAPEDAELRGGWLLADEVTEQVILKQFGTAIPDGTTKLARHLVDARKALLKVAKEAGLGAPPRYLALIKLDGDQIGARLEAARDEVELKRISSSLTKFAGRVKSILGKHKGQLIYAGGDDALALVPLPTALECAGELRQAFSQELAGESASAGLVYFHYKYSLREALQEARASEERAKDQGRDALGWTVVKRGGGPVTGVISWPLADSVQAMVKAFANGLSDRWIHHVERLAADFPSVGDVQQARLLLKHHVVRMAEASETSAAEDLVETALKLFDAAYSDLKERRRKHDPELDDGVGAALQQFVQLGLWASFIARDRRRS